jgi:hypothetical protein
MINAIEKTSVLQEHYIPDEIYTLEEINSKVENLKEINKIQEEFYINHS